MKVAIIDYGAGNTQSVKYALNRIGCEGFLTSNEKEIKTADKVIFPGVGEASSAMAKLKSFGLDTIIPRLTKPVLGICLGMQVLYDSSEEGGAQCLGIIPGKVRKMVASNGLRLPHMGWNTVLGMRSYDEGYFYFVHGYVAEVNRFSQAVSVHGDEFTSICRRDNFMGVQFHPEKSGPVGERLLRNFIDRGEV